MTSVPPTIASTILSISLESNPVMAASMLSSFSRATSDWASCSSSHAASSAVRLSAMANAVWVGPLS